MLRRPAAALTAAALVAAALVAAVAPQGVARTAPEPGTPEYVARDLANIDAAYGRITGPGGQLDNPAYLPALVTESTAMNSSSRWPVPRTRR